MERVEEALIEMFSRVETPSEMLIEHESTRGGQNAWTSPITFYLNIRSLPIIHKAPYHLSEFHFTIANREKVIDRRNTPLSHLGADR